jgi:hypothetical protein
MYATHAARPPMRDPAGRTGSLDTTSPDVERQNGSVAPLVVTVTGRFHAGVCTVEAWSSSTLRRLAVADHRRFHRGWRGAALRT